MSDQTTIQHLPLRGIRVLEIGGYIALPYATSLMAALGADVVKVERPVTGDDFRRQQNNRSPYFRQYNAGKRSLAVDLKQPDGVGLVKALIPRFDVVMENMRPGKVEQLGLDPATCTALRPDLVYASVTGFGSGGPLAQRPAYDTIGQSFGGLYTMLSDEGEPQLSGTCMADLITGLSVTTGVLAALVGRGSTGGAHVVETSLMEAITTLTLDALTQYFDSSDHGRRPRQEPNRQSRSPQAQNFVLKTSTGEAVAIHLSSSQKFWRSFLQAMDRLDLADDPRFTTYDLRVEHYFEIVEIARAEFATRTEAEWEQRLSAADVPFGPALTASGFLDHPQVAWLELAEPEVDNLRLIRPPWRFGGVRPPRGASTARVGEHTREVAAEVCDPTEIDRLIAAQVLYAD